MALATVPMLFTMNLDDKFKKMKELMDAGAIKIPTAKEANKLFESLHFKPHQICSDVFLNINLFDNGTRDGYKLNLLTGKFYKP